MLNVRCDDLSPELLGHRRVILIHVSQQVLKNRKSIYRHAKN